MKRDYAVDIAKAIGILLMILGHCQGIPWLLRNFIFSFHMPLFFIFSGYFFKLPQNMKEMVNKNIRHLVLPYLFTSLGVILFYFFMRNYSMVGQKIIGTMMSNGGWPSEKYGSSLPYIGPIWFLLALFWCKLFYVYIHKFTDKCLFASFIISTIALLIGKYIVNLPFGILTGFCGLVFYSMGVYWRKFNRPFNILYVILGLVIWAFCIRFSHLELATFDCKHYPISMIGSFVGTYVVYLISKRTITILRPFMCGIGENTLLILCYHTLSFQIIEMIKQYFLVPNGYSLNNWGNAILLLVLGLGLPYLHMKIKQLININKE